MSESELIPQTFSTGAVTLVPELNFFELCKSQLPQIYQNAESFMGIIQSICEVKQIIYDVIRSLCNSYNLYNSGGGVDATPTGLYLRVLASQIGVEINEVDDDEAVTQKIKKKINLAVSRGKLVDFFNYFNNIGIGGGFSNVAVQEVGNASIELNVPILNNPMSVPNPFDIFVEDMQRMKAAGVEIVSDSSTNNPFFQFADIENGIDEGNGGYGLFGEFGQPIGGAHFKNI